jgi:hypothetical protein
MRLLTLVVLWCLLLAVSWPLAILALVLLPVVALVALPFRLAGVCIEAAFALLRALLFLPARALGYRRR